MRYTEFTVRHAHAAAIAQWFIAGMLPGALCMRERCKRSLRPPLSLPVGGV